MDMTNDDDDVDKGEMVIGMMLTRGEDGLGMTSVPGRLVWAGLLPPFPPLLHVIPHHTYQLYLV